MTQRRATFPRSHRLTGRLQFGRVFAGKVRRSRGPLVIYAWPNALEHARIGISMNRRVGSAPLRNRIKRLLREAYRLNRHTLPAGFDLVIVVQRHCPLPLDEYQQVLTSLLPQVCSAAGQRQEQQHG